MARSYQSFGAAVNVLYCELVTATTRRMLGFTIPLLLTGFTMTTDIPFVNAALSRLPKPAEALAAFVVAFALALVYEAPHISMTETAAALVTTPAALERLRAFYIRLALGLLIPAIVFVASPLYLLLTERVMGIAPNVADAARPTLAVFLLWPVPIGWRRLHQGALIRHGHSKAVGAGAMIRLAVLVLSLGILTILGAGRLSGGTIGAWAMTLSVTAEAFYADRAARRLLQNLPTDGESVTTAHLRETFWPLVGTTALGTLMRPILGAGIAQAAATHSESQLAAWGLGFGLAQMVGGATQLLSQAAIAWESDPNPAQRRRGTRIILGIGLALSLSVATLAWTPLAPWILTRFYAAAPALTESVVPVLRCLIPIPFLLATSARARGRLIVRRQARTIRAVQIVNLAALVVALSLFLHWPNGPIRFGGAVLGAASLLVTAFCDAAVLTILTRRVTPPPKL